MEINLFLLIQLTTQALLNEKTDRSKIRLIQRNNWIWLEKVMIKFL